MSVDFIDQHNTFWAPYVTTLPSTNIVQMVKGFTVNQNGFVGSLITPDTLVHPLWRNEVLRHFDVRPDECLLLLLSQNYYEPHCHDVDEEFWLVAGRGQLTTPTLTVRLKAGVYFGTKQGQVHCLRAEKGHTLRFIGVFQPQSTVAPRSDFGVCQGIQNRPHPK